MKKYSRLTSWYFLLPIIIAFAGIPAVQANADIKIFSDWADFIYTTESTSATGLLPAPGLIPPGDDTASETVGSATFTISSPSTKLFIKQFTNVLPHNEIAISNVENLNVDLAAPVYAFGFDFYEPFIDEFDCGGGVERPCIDSTFEVTLKNGVDVVAIFSFNAPDDILAFIGVLSSTAFDRVEIREEVPRSSDPTDSVIHIDNEYFGEFYTNSEQPILPQLTVTQPAQGTVEGEGIYCSAHSDACAKQFFKGDKISLLAIPDSGYKFAGWNNCDEPDGDRCTLFMTEDKTVTANFSMIVYELNVVVSQRGSVSGEGILCPTDCTEAYQEGKAVILTATAEEGYVFRHWSNCDVPQSEQCTMIMDSDKLVTATFANETGPMPPPAQIRDRVVVTDIPTLSQWALIILASLLALVGIRRFNHHSGKL